MNAQQNLTKRPYFLTDGGIETTLIFHEGWDLPEFAVFPLVSTPTGRDALVRYYERYLQLAKKHGCGFILEAPTWRASPRWASLIGYSNDELAGMLRDTAGMLAELRESYVSEDLPILISGCIGPQDDGYKPDVQLSVDAAFAYRSFQILEFAKTDVDLVTAVTMTYPEEAIGIANAAAFAGLDCVVSFTLETDGRLPTGELIHEAIRNVDEQAVTPPIYYMINCAHPDHFGALFAQPADWHGRIGGVRANASRLSHAELDEADVLDEGDPQEFGEQHGLLVKCLPNLKVIGGCCGTDHRHVDAAGSNLPQ
ncbi:MAG: homocysteine S-methyltransferase [Pseudomonadales bacterium]|nr:homocysteine S-methyltransferase [Pseudomonadales bacterium]